MTPTGPTNVDRLRMNLKEGSLAMRVVDAHHTAAASGSTDAVKAVLQARLDQLRTLIDNAKA